jgi:putative aldouronate transport system substrate-binding protein
MELWALETVTVAGPPPVDWIAYQVIRYELCINLTYVIVPTGTDGEAKLNAAAAANDLPDLFQITVANNDTRGGLFRFVELGLVAPVDDLMPLMPQRAATHYNDPLLINLVTFDAPVRLPRAAGSPPGGLAHARTGWTT